MKSMFDRHLAVEGAYNVRDLGGYASASGETQWRRVLRSDGLHRVTPGGIDVLVASGLRLVIDLRHDHEIAAGPNPFREHAQVRYAHVPLFENLAPKSSPETNGANGDVLLQLYLRALASRGEAIRNVLDMIATADDGSVLFHCTAGKDRTGIIAALLLVAADVPRETILADYALTGEMITPLIDELVADAAARGHDVEAFKKLLGSEPHVMAAMLDHLDSQYGGPAAYLTHIGLSEENFLRLRTRLLGDAKEIA